MDSSDGEWIALTQPDGDVRRVWRPDEQPPSPDGRFGTWYVVSEDGLSRWEWVSTRGRTPAPATAARTAGPTLLESPEVASSAQRSVLTRRFVLGWMAAAAATATMVWALGALRGGSQYRVPAAAELAAEIGVSFDRFAIVDDVFEGRSGELAVTFVNLGRATRTFWTTIEAIGPGGVLATDTIAVRELRAGQSRTQPAFAGAPNLDGLAAASFTVTRTAGTPPPVT